MPAGSHESANPLDSRRCVIGLSEHSRFRRGAIQSRTKCRGQGGGDMNLVGVRTTQLEILLRHMTDPCSCQPTHFPFTCLRHRCRKTAHWHFLCQTRDDYRQLWEEGRGPGQLSSREAIPIAERFRCVHRGRVIDTRKTGGRGCAACRYEVYLCRQWGECTIFPKEAGLPHCTECAQRVEPTDAAKAAGTEE